MSCEPRWHETILGALEGELDRVEWRGLRAHLVGCAACRETYDHEARGAALLAGRDGFPAPAVVGMLAEDLLEALPAESDSGGPELEPSVGRRWVLRAALGIAASVLIAIAALTPEPSSPDAGLGAPGAVGVRGVRAPSAGFRVFCIDARERPPRVRASGVGDGPRIRCSLGDRLQFAYTAELHAPRFLQLFSIDEEGELRWYWPRESPRPLAVPSRDRPLPGSFELRSRHRAGRYTLYGLFSDDPVSRDEARTWAPSAGASSPRADMVQRLVFELEDEVR